jgi:hypothetical protein
VPLSGHHWRHGKRWVPHNCVMLRRRDEAAAHKSHPSPEPGDPWVNRRAVNRRAGIGDMQMHRPRHNDHHRADELETDHKSGAAEPPTKAGTTDPVA